MEEIKTGLFDILKYVITDMDTLNQISDASISPHVFMINRILSIEYPIHAQAFQIKGISGPGVIRSWAVFFSRFNYKRMPSFVYTKGAKKSKAEKETKLEFKPSELKEYAKWYSLNIKDLYSVIEFPGLNNMLMEELKEFEHMKKQITNPSQSKKEQKEIKE